MVPDLLILSYLRRHREIVVEKAASLTQQTAPTARRVLDELRNKGLVERNARKYALGAIAYEWLGLVGDRPKDLEMSEIRVRGLLLDELERRKETGIANRDIRSWAQYSRGRVGRLLRALEQEGQVISSGKRGQGGRWWLTKYAPTSNTSNGK